MDLDQMIAIFAPYGTTDRPDLRVVSSVLERIDHLKGSEVAKV